MCNAIFGALKYAAMPSAIKNATKIEVHIVKRFFVLLKTFFLAFCLVGVAANAFSISFSFALFCGIEATAVYLALVFFASFSSEEFCLPAVLGGVITTLDFLSSGFLPNLETLAF